jgi:L-lactate dehydrogenase complex protein LldG
MTTNKREQILGRIRQAVQVPAPHRLVPNPAPTTERYARGLPVIRQEAREWLPPVGETWEEQIALFASHAADLRAEFFLCADQGDMQERLASLAADCGWKQIATHPGTLTDSCAAALSLPTLITERGYDVAQLEKCDAALTQCDALVAQTGSVLITSRSAGGRTLSALTPHHIVLATRDQLVADLTAAFDQLTERYGANFPSLMSLITGPSRTGDIERILVLGAHGPKRLTIFCV